MQSFSDEALFLLDNKRNPNAAFLLVLTDIQNLAEREYNPQNKQGLAGTSFKKLIAKEFPLHFGGIVNYGIDIKDSSLPPILPDGSNIEDVQKNAKELLDSIVKIDQKIGNKEFTDNNPFHKEFLGKPRLISIGAFLYHVCRCSLSHEGTLKNHNISVQIEYGGEQKKNGNDIILSTHFVRELCSMAKKIRNKNP